MAGQRICMCGGNCSDCWDMQSDGVTPVVVSVASRLARLELEERELLEELGEVRCMIDELRGAGVAGLCSASLSSQFSQSE